MPNAVSKIKLQFYFINEIVIIISMLNNIFIVYLIKENEIFDIKKVKN